MWGEIYGGDYYTIKYDSSGVELWSARYDGPGHEVDQPLGIALNDSGNVYVTGFSWGIEWLNFDIATVKYNSSGVEQWVARYDGPAHSHDRAFHLALDDSNDGYIAGRSASAVSDDFIMVKFDSAGSEKWVTTYDGPPIWPMAQPASRSITQGMVVHPFHICDEGIRRLTCVCFPLSVC